MSILEGFKTQSKEHALFLLIPIAAKNICQRKSFRNPKSSSHNTHHSFPLSVDSTTEAE